MLAIFRKPARAALSVGLPRALFLFGVVEIAALVVNLMLFPNSPALLGKVAIFWRILFGLITGPAMLLVGGLILFRANGNRIGLCLVLASLGLISGQFAIPWSPVLSTFVSEFIILYSACIGVPALFYLFLTFPTGRVSPPSLVKWVTAYTILKFLGAILEIMASPNQIAVFPLYSNLIHLPVLDPYQNIISSTIGIHGAILYIGLFTGVASMLLRYRTAPFQQRQQIKWIIWALLLLMVAMLVDISTLMTRNAQDIQTNFPIFTFVLIAFTQIFLVASIGIGILRFQLFNIDRILNRTIVYGLLTTLVIAIYILTVGALSAFFESSGNLVISLIATGLVAVFFQPVRERMQGLVNQLMYGKRDDPYAVLADLNRRLQNTWSPQAVLPMVIETIASALKIPYAAILIKQGDDYQTAAEYRLQSAPRNTKIIPVSGGNEAQQNKADALVLPLVYQNTTIGQLVLAPREPGESFTAADRRILNDIANQVGVLTYTVQLNNDLQRSRERLVHLREEERRRLRRDLHDGLGTQLAGLSYNVNAIRNVVHQNPGQADTLLDGVADQIHTSLADLRRLVYDLRPPALDQLGLVSAIREQIVRFPWPDGLQASLEAPDMLPNLPAAVEVAAYRVILEGLTNVCRHAQAKNCQVRLQITPKGNTQPEILQIEIFDDGSGLPEDYHSGVGLLSMQERTAELGGDFFIGTNPTGGTRLCISLPSRFPEQDVR